MAGVISSHCVRHCFHHVLHSVWRRKPIVLAVVMVLTLFLVAVQYSTNGPPRTLMLDKKKSDSEGKSNFGKRRPSSNHRSEESNQYGIFDHQRRPDLENKFRITNAPFQPVNGAGDGRHYIPPMRVVHFDLKGAPPKISYYKAIFPLLKEAGANAILLEYEDMFPFYGTLKPAAAGNAYTREDIKAILDLAKIHNFEVIPLVQTFGHLEFFLKLPEFRHLREVDDFPQAICPSKNDSFNLVAQIIDQVMMMHPTSKFLHVGCDEVFHLGYCDKCRFKERDTLFLNHVLRVTNYVQEKHNVIPIIWHDMLIQMSTDRIKETLGKSPKVEVMMWNYIKDIYRFIPISTMQSFAEIFPNVWTASAFKGAFGETLTVPNVKMHLENNEAWIEVMAEHHKLFKSMRGIVITGWQRYDHLAVLCELLPSALPSLIVNLITASQGYYDSKTVFSKFDKIMQCSTAHAGYYGSETVDLDTDPYMWQRAASCNFPGASVFRMTQQHADTIKRVNDYLYDVTIHKAWLTEFNVRHNLTSPYRVDEGLQEYSTVFYPLTSLIRTARDALKEVYDDYTVSEWIEENIYPYVKKMEVLMDNSVKLKKAKTWPRRPLPPLDDLKRFAVPGQQGDDRYGVVNRRRRRRRR